MAFAEHLERLKADGFSIVESVFTATEVLRMIEKLECALTSDSESSIKSRGKVYAARNLIDSIPDIQSCFCVAPLLELLNEDLSTQFGLVRVLYFDKPSDRSWYLPWHKDLTIAVKDNSLPTTHFSKPTCKAGVDHVEASEQLLENMLTLRIHLDEVTNSNGPLEVIPGSHATGKAVESSSQEAVKILVNAGDVLAMRPMISHASGHTDSEGNLRRRILHLEFSATEQLPDGYQWSHFVRTDHVSS